MDLLVDLPLPADGTLMTIGVASFLALAALVFGILSQGRKSAPARGDASWWDGDTSGDGD